jgi:hypothetical protein
VAAVPTVELQLKSKSAPNRALELDRVRVAFVRILITLLTHQKKPHGCAERHSGACTMKTAPGIPGAVSKSHGGVPAMVTPVSYQVFIPAL